MMKLVSLIMVLVVVMVSGCISSLPPINFNETPGKFSDMGAEFDYPTTWKLEKNDDYFKISSKGVNNNSTFFYNKVCTEDSLKKLVAIQKSLILNPSNRIIYEKNLTVDGSPAYEIVYTARINKNATFQKRMVMVKKYSSKYKSEVFYCIWANLPRNSKAMKEFDLVIKTFHIP